MSSCKKSYRLPSQMVEFHYDKPLHLIHSNIWKSTIVSYSCYRYYICFVNDFSHYTWVYPLKRELDFFPTFYAF